MHAGRASASPVVDLFMTLLHFGEEGYRKLLADRKVRHHSICQAHNGTFVGSVCLHEGTIETFDRGYTYVGDANKPSLDWCVVSCCHWLMRCAALSLESFGEELSLLQNHTSITYLGSMLFQRGVSGTR